MWIKINRKRSLTLWKTVLIQEIVNHTSNEKKSENKKVCQTAKSNIFIFGKNNYPLQKSIKSKVGKIENKVGILIVLYTYFLIK